MSTMMYQMKGFISLYAKNNTKFYQKYLTTCFVSVVSENEMGILNIDFSATTATGICWTIESTNYSHGKVVKVDVSANDGDALPTEAHTQNLFWFNEQMRIVFHFLFTLNLKSYKPRRVGKTVAVTASAIATNQRMATKRLFLKCIRICNEFQARNELVHF